jgi:gamma-glutamylaminecyclotransferase
MSNKVFVYGTLKSGGQIRGLNQFGDGAVIVGKAQTVYPDYDMIDLGAFPGVVKGGTYKIQGEVWEVNDETMQDLDAIEGYPDFYNREVTMTTQGKAWMYYLPRDTYAGYENVDSPQVEIINDEVKMWHI